MGNKAPETIWFNTKHNGAHGGLWHDATPHLDQTKKENREYHEGFAKYIRADAVEKIITELDDRLIHCGLSSLESLAIEELMDEIKALLNR